MLKTRCLRQTATERVEAVIPKMFDPDEMTMTDVEFQLEEGPNLRAHKFILSLSPVLKAALNNIDVRICPIPVISLQGFHRESVQNLLHFLYKGVVDMVWGSEIHTDFMKLCKALRVNPRSVRRTWGTSEESNVSSGIEADDVEANADAATNGEVAPNVEDNQQIVEDDEEATSNATPDMDLAEKADVQDKEVVEGESANGNAMADEDAGENDISDKTNEANENIETVVHVNKVHEEEKGVKSGDQIDHEDNLREENNNVALDLVNIEELGLDTSSDNATKEKQFNYDSVSNDEPDGANVINALKDPVIEGDASGVRVDIENYNVITEEKSDSSDERTQEMIGAGDKLEQVSLKSLVQQGPMKTKTTGKKQPEIRQEPEQKEVPEQDQAEDQHIEVRQETEQEIRQEHEQEIRQEPVQEQASQEKEKTPEREPEPRQEIEPERNKRPREEENEVRVEKRPRGRRYDYNLPGAEEEPKEKETRKTKKKGEKAWYMKDGKTRGGNLKFRVGDTEQYKIKCDYCQTDIDIKTLGSHIRGKHHQEHEEATREEVVALLEEKKNKREDSQQKEIGLEPGDLLKMSVRGKEKTMIVLGTPPASGECHAAMSKILEGLQGVLVDHRWSDDESWQVPDEYESSKESEALSDQEVKVEKREESKSRNKTKVKQVEEVKREDSTDDDDFIDDEDEDEEDEEAKRNWKKRLAERKKKAGGDVVFWMNPGHKSKVRVSVQMFAKEDIMDLNYYKMKLLADEGSDTDVEVKKVSDSDVSSKRSKSPDNVKRMLDSDTDNSQVKRKKHKKKRKKKKRHSSNGIPNSSEKYKRPVSDSSDEDIKPKSKLPKYHRSVSHVSSFGETSKRYNSFTKPVIERSFSTLESLGISHNYGLSGEAKERSSMPKIPKIVKPSTEMPKIPKIEKSTTEMPKIPKFAKIPKIL